MKKKRFQIKYNLIYSILILQLATIFNSNAQEKEAFNPREKFPIDSAKIWMKEIMLYASKNHPGFYRYTR